MSWILSYGCTSSAGPATADFWQSLKEARDHSHCIPTENWPVPASFQPQGCRWQVSQAESEQNSRQKVHPGAHELSVKTVLVTELLQAWRQAFDLLESSERERIKNSKLGVILASTKGFIDDFIWNANEDDLITDPLAPLLKAFLIQSELKVIRSTCVSNACTSAVSAIFLAEQWLKSGSVREVLVLATDRVGPFVLQGFQCLKALTSDQVKPFAKDRSGLRLGEAAVALLLSSSQQKFGIKIKGTGIFTEGFAATRPSESGQGLKNACEQISEIQRLPPDLIIAHGTGTALNDSSEDQAITELFSHLDHSPWITATKGSIGHTLGASGGMDVIAACEVLKKQTLFPIANTKEIDPTFKGRYLYAGNKNEWEADRQIPLYRVLVTSIGFGGMNAAVMLEQVGEPGEKPDVEKKVRKIL